MEDIMFKEYLNHYRYEITKGNTNNGICFDGAVNPSLFFTHDKRLMFLLKETNGNNMNGKRNEVTTDWDYMAWVQKQANCEENLYRSVFRNIAMWSKMFDTYITGEKPNIDELIGNNGLIINKELCKSLENIAIINLKKSWGTEQTDWNAMNIYLNDSVRREILIHQVNVLEPTLVLCGGTFDFAHIILGDDCQIQKKECANGTKIEFFENEMTTFVKCYHPSKPGWSRKDSFDYMNNILGALL